MIQNDVLDTAKLEGRAEGIAEGRAEGRAEGIAARNAEIVKAMARQQFSVETMARITGLSMDDIQSLLK